MRQFDDGCQLLLRTSLSAFRSLIYEFFVLTCSYMDSLNLDLSTLLPPQIYHFYACPGSSDSSPIPFPLVLSGA